MSKVADYNPLKRIRLPGAVIEDPAGLVIVVGPNSSGKTLFLNDIQNYLTGTDDLQVICKSMAANQPATLSDYLQDLVENNLLKKTGEDGYLPYVSTLTDQPGVPMPGGALPSGPRTREVDQFTGQQLKKAHQGFNAGVDGGNNQHFFKMVGPVLVAPLTLVMRRHICDKSSSFDWRQARPAHPLQSLHVNTHAQERLAEETGRVFGNVAWLDTVSEKDVFQLKVSGTPLKWTPLSRPKKRDSSLRLRSSLPLLGSSSSPSLGFFFRRAHPPA